MTTVTLNAFLQGACTLACWAIGLFFLRFWRVSRDRLFLFFFAAFWAFANSWRDIFRNGVCDHAIKEMCRLYVSRSVQCEYCGNRRYRRHDPPSRSGTRVRDGRLDVEQLPHVADIAQPAARILGQASLQQPQH